MPLKITLACLIAANLALGACAPLIIVGAVGAGAGLTASELRDADSAATDSSPTAAAPVAASATASTAAPSGESSEVVAAPLESVESRSLE